MSEAEADLSAATGRWLIGAGAECTTRIRCSQDRVAELSKRNGRLFLQDLGSGEIILVNGDGLPRGALRELTRFDDINVAGTAIIIGPEHFLGDTKLGIDTTELRYVALSGSSERVLCEGVFLRAKPGTFTAIMGPAGSGKTVFLNLINGYKMPAKGQVMIGRKYDLHRHSHYLSNFIGYVPQDDVMLPELTVRQSLDCQLRLRFPDMVASVRARLMLDACHQIGVGRSETDKFLDSFIGSTEFGERGLSGGERKRANIAHELLLKPLILILDEPTSGLSSFDADQMVRLLRDLASVQGITVVATMHQPSSAAFKCFDDLLVMHYGGTLAYYGPASTAKSFFEKASEMPCPGESNPAEFILSLLSDQAEAHRLIRYYRTHAVVSPLEEPARSEPSPPKKSGKSIHLGGFADLSARVSTLVQRNLQVLRADKPNLWLTFGQAPILGLLMLLGFFGFREDGAGFEEFTRTMYGISTGKQPYQAEGKPVPIDEVVDQARRSSVAPTSLISRQAAFRRGAVYFVMVAASIWFGVLGGCREVVAERHVLEREFRLGLALTPYLSAKILVQSLQTALQTGLLSLIVGPLLLRLSFVLTLYVWGVLWLVALAAAALGLLVSCLAPSYRFALTAVPLLMVPQMILGGMLRPQADVAEGSIIPQALSCLTLQRWGFEAALSMDSYSHGGVMLQVTTLESGDRYGALGLLQFAEGTLPQCFFGEKGFIPAVLLPLGCLAGGALLFLLAARYELGRVLSGHRRERWERKVSSARSENSRSV